MQKSAHSLCIAVAGAAQSMQALRGAPGSHGSCSEGLSALHLQGAARGLRLAAGMCDGCGGRS